MNEFDPTEMYWEPTGELDEENVMWAVMELIRRGVCADVQGLGNREKFVGGYVRAVLTIYLTNWRPPNAE